jgi:hypothetical protein
MGKVMIMLSLNLRGTGGTLKLASVRSVLDKTHPDIVFFQETLVHSEKARNFMSTLRPNWFSCVVNSVGTSGGLLVTWDPNVFDLVCISYLWWDLIDRDQFSKQKGGFLLKCVRALFGAEAVLDTGGRLGFTSKKESYYCGGSQLDPFLGRGLGRHYICGTFGRLF